MAAAGGSLTTSFVVRWPQTPAFPLALCKPRAPGQLGWRRPPCQSYQMTCVHYASTRSALVRSREPSQASKDRVPEVMEFLKGLGLEGEEAVRIMKRGQLALSRVRTLEERAAALESLAFSREEISLLISRAPDTMLRCNPDTIRASVGKFQELFGLTPLQVKEAILKEPCLMANADSLRKAVKYLLDLGLSQAQACKIFLRYPRAMVYLQANTEELEALQELGFSKEEVAAAIVKFPAVLGNKVACNYRQLVAAMDEQFGVDAETCRRLVLASPVYLGLKTATVVQKVDYLVEVMGRNVLELLKCPQYVSYSLEKRIRPRHETCTREGMMHLSLGTMMTYPNAKFEDCMRKGRGRKGGKGPKQ